MTLVPTRVTRSLFATIAASCAVVALAVPGTASAATGTKVLDYHFSTQTKTETCASATTSQILTYEGRPTTEGAFCKLVNGVPDGGACPNNPVNGNQVVAALHSIGYAAAGIEPDDATFADVVSNINAGHPLEANIQWKPMNTGLGGHFVAIYGYRTDIFGTQYIEVANTLPTSDSFYPRINGEVTWSHFINNNDYQFYWLIGGIAKS